MYFYSRSGAAKQLPAAAAPAALGPGLPRETHTAADQAPNTWLEALYFFAEGLRYTYAETLGKWRTADLLIGLAYLSRKQGASLPADVAAVARPLGEGCSAEQCEEALEELRVVQRFMRYCRAMRERKLHKQMLKFRDIGIEATDILLREPRAGLLRPSYVVVRDRKLRSIVLAVRGTQSLKDMFTNLTAASKPHHMIDLSSGVVLGHSHFGMLAAARWIKGQVSTALRAELAANPGYTLRITGHSMGGGAAAMLTMMLRESCPEFSDATCVALACPGCMTLELARSCRGYVTTVVNSTDLVPTVSPTAADALREQVMRSEWYTAFRADVRSTFVVRAVEGSLRGVGSATTWTARATSASLSACYAAGPAVPRCYQHRPAPPPADGGLDGPHARSDSGVWEAQADDAFEVARQWAELDENAVQVSVSDSQEDGGSRRPRDNTRRRRGSKSETTDFALQDSAKAPAPRGWLSVAGSVRVQTLLHSGRAGLASGLLPRWWFQGCRSGPHSGHNMAPGATMQPGTPAVQVSPANSCYAIPADSCYASDRAQSAGSDVLQECTAPRAMFMGDSDSDSDGPESASLSDTSPDLLAAELSRVTAAVSAEEAAEAGRQAALHGRHPESGPGHEAGPGCPDAGEGSGSGRPGACSGSGSDAVAAARRSLYPAGRILHLVPAHLVWGQPARYRRQLSHQTALASAPHAPCGPGGEGEDDEGRERGALRWVVLHSVPQEAYGRIRLCRTMLQDHFIPSYEANLDAAMHTLIETCILPQRQAEAGQVPTCAASF